MSDHKPTRPWWAHIISPENRSQISTKAGAAAIGVGGVLQTTGNVYAMIAGAVLIALGGSGVGHNANP